MDKVISSGMMRLAISAAQEAGGAQMVGVLRKAGWGPYLEHLPADDHVMIGTVADMQALSENVYTMVGEDIFRLFQRNIGQKMGEGMLHDPAVQALVAQAPGIPPAQQLGWFLREYVARM